jgi:Gpi18-like mannosyltransferase
MAVATARRTARRTARHDILVRLLARHPVARDALAAWLGQRIVLVALVYLWQATSGRLSPAFFFHVWTTWDGRLYADIARGGYWQLWQAAFYPLFPLLEHVLAPVANGSVEGAGLIVANAASLVAFVLLRQLVARDLGQASARRTLLYLILSPVGVFLACTYTESLFLALALGTFLALRARRWLLAGALAGLATLTRATGLALLLPFAVTAGEALLSRLAALTAWQRLRACAAVALPALVPVAVFAGCKWR